MVFFREKGIDLGNKTPLKEMTAQLNYKLTNFGCLPKYDSGQGELFM